MHGISYCSTDLDIESDVSLVELINEFGEDFSANNYRDQPSLNRLWLSVNALHLRPDVESSIKLYCNAIESLSSRGRALWDGAHKRVFNIGYQVGEPEEEGDRWFESIIHPSTLTRISSAGAGVIVTIYPPPSDGSQR